MSQFGAPSKALVCMICAKNMAIFGCLPRNMGLRVGEGGWEESASFLLIFGEILSPPPTTTLVREKLWSLRDSLENPLFSFGRGDRACLYPELGEERRPRVCKIEVGSSFSANSAS